MPTAYEELWGTFDVATIESNIPDVCSGDGIARTWEQCQEWAEKINCVCIQATDTQLFIDIDTERAYAIFKETSRKMKWGTQWFKSMRETPSKQGLPHRHIVIELRQLQPLIVRIAMQAALGSDPMRELLSIRRALDGEDNVVIFFEPK